MLMDLKFAFKTACCLVFDYWSWLGRMREEVHRPGYLRFPGEQSVDTLSKPIVKLGLKADKKTQAYTLFRFTCAWNHSFSLGSKM